jgi:hypothetical protein
LDSFISWEACGRSSKIKHAAYLGFSVAKLMEGHCFEIVMGKYSGQYCCVKGTVLTDGYRMIDSYNYAQTEEGASLNNSNMTVSRLIPVTVEPPYKDVFRLSFNQDNLRI